MGKTFSTGLLTNAISTDSSNRVGIGTTSPSSILEVNGSTTTTSIRLGSPTGSGTYNLISLNGNSEEGQYIGLAGGGGTDTNLYIQSGNAGSVLFRTGNGSVFTERMRITGDGLNTYIGKNATGNFQLSVDSFGNYNFNNAIGGGYRNYLNYAAAIFMITSNNGTSGMFMSSGGSSWNVFSSDVRVKKNFEPSQGLAELLQIEAIKYHMKTDSDDAPKRLGFKAQNLLPLIPEMVTTNPMALDDDGKPLYTITPDYLLPVLVKAIQELKAEIDQLKAK